MFDWYCETHRCNMSVKSCITRRTLSQSKQRWPKGGIYPECRVCENYAAKEDEVGRNPKVEETKPEPTSVEELTCLICNKRKPRDHFKPNDSLRGCSSACLECTQEALKHPHPDILIDGEPNVPTQECNPIGLMPDPIIADAYQGQCDVAGIKMDSMAKPNAKPSQLSFVNFTGHMDIHDAVADLAKKEFRTFDLQVLYILNQYIDRNRVMEASYGS